FHFHREAHRRINGANALSLQGGDDLAGDLVDVIARVMELEIGHRARRAADRLAVQPADEAKESPGAWEVAEDVVPLHVKGGPANLDEPHVVGTGFASEVLQPIGIKLFGRGRRWAGGSLLVELFHRWMVGKVHGASPD